MPGASHYRLIWAALALCGLGVLAAAWFEYEIYSRPIVLPQPRGPHSVGRMLFDWTDPDRGRKLTVVVWYPALISNAPIAEYVPRNRGELAAKGPFREIRVAARNGATMADGEFPLLVLSPAMARIPTDYTTLAEDLASFGYIVAGVTPPHSAAVVTEWVADFHFAVDRVLSEPGLKEHVDQHRIGVLGHSFGGAAAMHALETDERFRRGANLDGAPQGAPITHLARPLLIVNGAPLPASQEALNDRIVAEFHGICSVDVAGCRIEEVPEAGHMNFSDAGVFPSRFPIPRSHFDLTDIDGTAFLRKTSGLLRAFFDEM